MAGAQASTLLSKFWQSCRRKFTIRCLGNGLCSLGGGHSEVILELAFGLRLYLFALTSRRLSGTPGLLCLPPSRFQRFPGTPANWCAPLRQGM